MHKHSYIATFPRLSIQMQGDEKKITYTFVGTIDDGFHFKDLKIISTPTVEFQLSEVNQLNSIGTREWILMLRQFSVSSDIHYTACSVALVDAFNSVPQLYENIHIDSFFAPYYCPKCAKEVSILIPVTSDFAQQLQQAIAPEYSHDICGTNLEFDALEESYFGFLKDLKF